MKRNKPKPKPWLPTQTKPWKPRTEEELKKVLRRLGPLHQDQVKSLVCLFVGHSQVVDVCFGQVTCSRCGDVLGDTIEGAYDDRYDVIKGHDCEMCRNNARRLSWRDLLLIDHPYPNGVPDEPILPAAPDFPMDGRRLK